MKQSFCALSGSLLWYRPVCLSVVWRYQCVFSLSLLIISSSLLSSPHPGSARDSDNEVRILLHSASWLGTSLWAQVWFNSAASIGKQLPLLILYIYKTPASASLEPCRIRTDSQGTPNFWFWLHTTGSEAIKRDKHRKLWAVFGVTWPSLSTPFQSEWSRTDMRMPCGEWQ